MKESYASKPADVETFQLGDVSDIIMRKNIVETSGDDGEAAWECDERQLRTAGSVTAADVRADFSRYWAHAGDELCVDDVKEAKLKELSEACHNAIVAGFDVTLADGEEHHFSLTVEDQLNINALYGMIASGTAEKVPYHADGEACTYYTAEDFAAIVQAAAAHKTYHESYYNSLKVFVESKRTESSIGAIEYGTEVPAQYQSDVLKALLA